MIEIVRAFLAYILPINNASTWPEIARSAAQTALRLAVVAVLYAILCHAIRTGVADWLKALLLASVVTLK